MECCSIRVLHSEWCHLLPYIWPLLPPFKGTKALMQFISLAVSVPYGTLHGYPLNTSKVWSSESFYMLRFKAEEQFFEVGSETAVSQYRSKMTGVRHSWGEASWSQHLASAAFPPSSSCLILMWPRCVYVLIYFLPRKTNCSYMNRSHVKVHLATAGNPEERFYPGISPEDLALQKECCSIKDLIFS